MRERWGGKVCGGWGGEVCVGRGGEVCVGWGGGWEVCVGWEGKLPVCLCGAQVQLPDGGLLLRSGGTGVLLWHKFCVFCDC